MSDPDQEEMRRKRLARLSAMSGNTESSPVVGEKEKSTTSPGVTEMEVDSQPQPSLKSGASQISLDFDSGIETMEIEPEKISTLSPTKRNRTTSSANYESTPEQILGSLQTILSVTIPGADSSSPSGSLSCPQAVALAPNLAPSDLVSAVLAEAVSSQSQQGSVKYLVSCYTKLKTEEAHCGKRGTVPPLSNILSSARNQIISTLSNVLRGVWSGLPSSNSSLLYNFISDEQFPQGLLQDLVVHLAADSDAFSAVFNPLLQHILSEAHKGRLTSSRFMVPLQSLSRMVDIRLVTGVRPVADQLVAQPQWIPGEITQAGGLEVVGLSFLGPFLSPSVFPEEDPGVADQYFSEEPITTHHVKTACSALQPSLEILRTQLHQLFHLVLANKSSRMLCLDWVSTALARNFKRQQLQANERLVAGDGFMLNLVTVLQHLSSKVKQDKVDPAYLHMDTSRIDTTDESRLKASSTDVKEYSEKLEKGKEQNFPTECWFLTLQAHHIGILPIIRRYQRRLRALRELQKMVDDLEKSEPAWRNHPSASHNRSMIKKWKQQIKRQSKSKACADIGLLDEHLFSRCIAFYATVADHMMRLLDPLHPHQPNIPLPAEPPMLFRLLPEWVVDDMADFLLFGLQFMPGTVSNIVDLGLVTWLLTMLCHTHYFSNPYLVSKLVEVLFVVNPQVQEKTGEIYSRIMTHPISQEFLPSALMRFYTEVEQTGSSNEFYDKFTIRYHISIIMKSMWESPVHKMAIVTESNNGKNFIKFINMMMNDTTFLLDESLDALKRIHEVQDDMTDPAKWAAQSQEQQTSRARQLSQDERQCRSYLTLARETVDMFYYLTQGIQEPFLRPELADRLACMLDAVLEQLTNGPKCKNLKVKNPEKYSWDPKWLLSHLIDIYLHLDSDRLALAIANDQRSFKLETFHDTAARMENTLGRTMLDVEKFRNLGEKANKIVIEKIRQDEEWENVPTEFECAIMGEMMDDPVILPSGNVCDRKNIERHILSTPNDPFNRQPLTEDMLKPATELKKKMEDWKQQQRSKK